MCTILSATGKRCSAAKTARRRLSPFGWQPHFYACPSSSSLSSSSFYSSSYPPPSPPRRRRLSPFGWQPDFYACPPDGLLGQKTFLGQTVMWKIEQFEETNSICMQHFHCHSELMLFTISQQTCDSQSQLVVTLKSHVLPMSLFFPINLPFDILIDLSQRLTR